MTEAFPFWPSLSLLLLGHTVYYVRAHTHARPLSGHVVAFSEEERRGGERGGIGREKKQTRGTRGGEGKEGKGGEGGKKGKWEKKKPTYSNIRNLDKSRSLSSSRRAHYVVCRRSFLFFPRPSRTSLSLSLSRSRLGPPTSHTTCPYPSFLLSHSLSLSFSLSRESRSVLVRPLFPGVQRRYTSVVLGSRHTHTHDAGRTKILFLADEPELGLFCGTTARRPPASWSQGSPPALFLRGDTVAGVGGAVHPHAHAHALRCF